MPKLRQVHVLSDTESGESSEKGGAREIAINEDQIHVLLNADCDTENQAP